MNDYLIWNILEQVAKRVYKASEPRNNTLYFGHKLCSPYCVHIEIPPSFDIPAENEYLPHFFATESGGVWTLSIRDTDDFDDYKREVNLRAKNENDDQQYRKLHKKINKQISNEQGRDGLDIAFLIGALRSRIIKDNPANHQYTVNCTIDTDGNRMTIVSGQTGKLEIGSLVTGGSVPADTYVTDFDINENWIDVDKSLTTDLTPTDYTFDLEVKADTRLAEYEKVARKIEKKRKQIEDNIEDFTPPWTDVTPLYPEDEED